MCLTGTSQDVSGDRNLIVVDGPRAKATSNRENPWARLSLSAALASSLSPSIYTPLSHRRSQTSRWWMAAVSQGAFSFTLSFSPFTFFSPLGSNFRNEVKWNKQFGGNSKVFGLNHLALPACSRLSSTGFSFLFLTFFFFSNLPSLSLSIYISVYLSQSIRWLSGGFEHCFHCDNQVLLKLIGCWIFIRTLSRDGGGGRRGTVEGLTWLTLFLLAEI